MKYILLIAGYSLVCFFANAQVAINTDGSQPNAKSMLDIKSSGKGVLLPRCIAAPYVFCGAKSNASDDHRSRNDSI
jgi:hypothetical protein